MTKGAQSLREILDELHTALRESPDIGDEGRAALLKTVAEIEEVLNEDRAEGSTTIRQQLSQAIGQFEESHPKLTSVVGRVADSLSDLGI
ncbi:MAG: DUF4404 family protein [Myxococcota bacterium]|jgi:hypothetical protein|nr:DUF4404 family protein [Myxococcota bacterium]